MFADLGKAYTGSIDKQRLHVGTLTQEQRDKLDELWSRFIIAVTAGDERKVSLFMYIVESTVIQYTLIDANKRKAELHARREQELDRQVTHYFGASENARHTAAPDDCADIIAE